MMGFRFHPSSFFNVRCQGNATQFCRQTLSQSLVCCGKLKEWPVAQRYIFFQE
jgi:hypothetical protein